MYIEHKMSPPELTHEQWQLLFDIMNHSDDYAVVRKYNTTKPVGRPRIIPDDELTAQQLRKRKWNEHNKEHIRAYNKERRNRTLK